MRPGASNSIWNGSRGSTLLWVLVTLSLGLAAVLFFLQRQQSPARLLTREQNHRQAFYLAEAGLHLQLFREQFFDSSGSKAAPGRSQAQLDSIRFFLDSNLKLPQVESNRAQAFLEITSRGSVGPETVTVKARFGRSLDRDLFGPALTLFSDSALLPLHATQVRGSLRLKTPMPGVSSLPFPKNFAGINYADSYVDTKFRAFEADLQRLLGLEGSSSGNGDFTSATPPPFDAKHEIGFPMGQATLRQEGGGEWELRGPAVIAARGDIRVRGHVHLVDITLLSEQNLYLEGDVTADNLSAFAERNLYVQDQSRVEGLLVSGCNLFLRDRAEVTGNSLILQSAGPACADSTPGIRIVNEAKCRGFVISTGPKGRIVMGDNANKVTGILMAQEVWPAGWVLGSVVATHVRCGGPQNGGRDCLGDGNIDREALPADFVQPWDMGLNADRTQLRFKLLTWESR